MVDVQLFKVVMLGVAFMLVFTAFQSCAMIQTAVLESAPNSTGFGNKTGTHAGYYSLSTIYLVFTFANFLAPSIVLFCGARLSMVFAAVTYIIYLAAFLILRPWLLYLCSALLGLGAAVIWTGQGNYVTVASTEETMGRNSGVLWALLQCSLLFGSIFIYGEFRTYSNDEEITDTLRYTIYGTFTALGVIGAAVLALLRRPSPSADSSLHLQPYERLDVDSPTPRVQVLEGSGIHAVDGVETQEVAVVGAGGKAVKDFVATFVMLTKIDMLLLAITMFYTGIELTFWSGVYGTCVANTSKFGSHSYSLLGISGMLLAAGEILGGLAFGIFGKRTARYSRMPIILLGLVVHLAAFACTLVNLPAESPRGATGDSGGFMTPNVYLAMACSFMLGLGDSCWNTQLYSILGTLFPGDDSAQAFALFKFFQSLAAAIGFFYSDVLLLHWQLLILAIWSVLGFVAFGVVEMKAYRIARERDGDHID